MKYIVVSFFLLLVSLLGKTQSKTKVYFGWDVIKFVDCDKDYCGFGDSCMQCLSCKLYQLLENEHFGRNINTVKYGRFNDSIELYIDLVLWDKFIRPKDYNKMNKMTSRVGGYIYYFVTNFNKNTCYCYHITRIVFGFYYDNRKVYSIVHDYEK